MQPKVASTLLEQSNAIASSRDQEFTPFKKDPTENLPDKSKKDPQTPKQKGTRPLKALPKEYQPLEKLAGDTPSITSSFLIILSKISQTKSDFVNWVGNSVYLGVLLRQKKTKAFKKGAMVDHKAE